MYVKNFLSFNMFFVTEIAKLKKNNIEIKLKIGKMKLTSFNPFAVALLRSFQLFKIDTHIIVWM